MNKDPYTLLGVSRSATDEEIKRAYRELAKKYHPDNYANSDLADLAEEKMKEINEAYDFIQKERSGQGNTGYGASGHGSGYGNGYDSGYGSYRSGYGQSSYNDSDGTRFAEVRRLINSGSYAEAEVILNGMASADRGAEWNYLMGVLYLRRGWYHDAAKYFDIACTMDPQNAEYRAARARMSGGIFSGGTAYADDRRGTESEFCNLCSSLMIADCCCECMGGDLIPCC